MHAILRNEVVQKIQGIYFFNVIECDKQENVPVCLNNTDPDVAETLFR